MGMLKIKKMKLLTRIAISFGILVFICVTALLLFINYSIQKSMENYPLLQEIAPNSKSITVNQPASTYYSQSWLADTPEIQNMTKETEVTAAEFNKMFSQEVFRRMRNYSMIAAFFIGAVTIGICFYLSKKLMKPLAEIADTTHRLTVRNMDLRLKLPETNDEIARLASNYNTTLDKLQTAFLDLEQFNSYASHELRNSLAVLLTCLETGRDDVDLHKTLNLSASYVKRISKNIDDMLALSSRQLKDSFEPVDMALLAAQAVDEYSISGRKIVLELPDEGVMPVNGKEIWLYRVISNLLDNALKHSGEDNPVTIRVKQYQAAVVVEVMDKGAGIDPLILDNIWQQYFSYSAAKNKGIGLGLALVQHVVDLCGGMAWVESNPGKGSIFYISLPVIHNAT